VPGMDASDAASAGTIELRGVYGVSVVAPECVHAGGMRAPGIGPGGYGCKTEKSEVEFTLNVRCTAICETCAPRHHRIGIYRILHGTSERKRGG
jgi:hypothetical protein